MSINPKERQVVTNDNAVSNSERLFSYMKEYISTTGLFDQKYLNEFQGDERLETVDFFWLLPIFTNEFCFWFHLILWVERDEPSVVDIFLFILRNLVNTTAAVFFAVDYWVTGLILLAVSVLLWGLTYIKYRKKIPNQLVYRLSHFGIINYFLDTPDLGIPSNFLTAFIIRAINISLGVYTAILLIVIGPIREAYGCYPSSYGIADLNYGECPKQHFQGSPICSVPGITCDNRHSTGLSEELHYLMWPLIVSAILYVGFTRNRIIYWYT